MRLFPKEARKSLYGDERDDGIKLCQLLFHYLYIYSF